MNNKRTLYFIILSSSIILLIFLLIDFFQTRANIDKLEFNFANSTIITFNSEFKHTLETNAQLEDLILNQLNTSAVLADLLESQGLPTKNQIQNIVDEFDLTSVSYLDNQFNLILTNNDSVISKAPNEEFLVDVANFENPEVNWLDLGLMYNPFTNQLMYMLIRKREKTTGYVLIGIGSQKLLQLRKNFGVGAKISEFAKNPEIIFIALQDTNGIYAATPNFKELSAINSDLFLQKAYNSTKSFTRIKFFQGQKILEVVKAFNIEDDIILTRVGLSLDKIEQLKQKSSSRLILIAILILVLVIIILSYLLTREKLQNLKAEHTKVQANLKLILDNIADGVIALDDSLQIFAFNDAAATSLNIEHSQTIGKNYLEFFNNDIFNVKKVIENKAPFSEEKLKFVTNNSNVKYFAYSTNILMNEAKIDAIIILLRDISEQVKAQQQMELKEKQIAIGQLASGIAHEIRNPLNAINIIIQRFQMEFVAKEDNDEFQKMLVTLRSEISRINEIIEQFLNFARPPKLDIQQTNLSELIEETIYLMQIQAKQNNIILEKIVEPNLIAYLDRSKIKQVLINLIKNAIEAIDESGKITIEAKLKQNNIIIKISDTGKGISDNIKNKIFSLYFTTKKTGTGLGLSIVHQIISEHNGEIECNSIEGIGTTFEITLPLKP